MSSTDRCVGKGAKETMVGGFKKLMWYGFMKEFNCKATCTWSECGRVKDTSFTHRQKRRQEAGMEVQLDYIIWPRWRSDEAYIYNNVKKTWDSWDHYPIYARIQEDEIEVFPCGEKEKSVDRMEAKDRCAKN